MTTTAEIRHPYQDPGLPPERRADDLLKRLRTEDKAGLLLHPHGGLCDPTVAYEEGRLPLATQIREGRITHFALQGTASDARETAAFHNRLQEIALEHPLGIPVTLSSDPRHSSQDNLLTSNATGTFSQWPDTLGLGAIGSAEVARRYAEVVREEYLAVGIRLALHPQIDLVTEPRWARGVGSFSEDPELTSRLAAAYIRGLQGERLGPDSVATMTKHFPGGGPQLDGRDPHFADGREQVYPGGRFETHLAPFRAAIEAGTAQMMPYYGMPVGTEYEEVGFAFNKAIITTLLREQLGFEGVVCTDWTLVTDIAPDFPAKAWGVEHLDREGRVLRLLDAGVDQLGGESCFDLIVGMLRSGRLPEHSLDASLRRILLDKFTLGLFDDRRFVDVERANQVVGSPANVRAGLEAQQHSLTLLENDSALLPLPPGAKVYVEGLDPTALAGIAEVVPDVAEADAVILRLSSPNYSDPALGWMGSLHQGSLEFDAETVRHVSDLARRLPTVVDVRLERPAVLTDLRPVGALLGSFGTTDRPFVEVLFGHAEPRGTLPFDLPRSMEAVERSRSDVPFDTDDPLFAFGHGLRYEGGEPS